MSQIKINYSQRREKVIQQIVDSFKVLQGDRNLVNRLESDSFLKSVFHGDDINGESSIYVVNGLEDFVCETLAEGGVNCLRDFSVLDTQFKTTYDFIKSSDMIPNIDDLILKSKEFVKESVPLLEVDDDITGNRHPLYNSPLTIIDDITEHGVASTLYSHAYINTVGELAEFPQKFPGMYRILSDSKFVPDLDVYITKAQELLS
eukprot:TRINITY_DN10993_c0_g1_i1.p1 TRINITY_DN10993_c0_g1~~TRINITY_DN10993_c0_g1_i1.p1  ORF type:complete len:204 (+),score=29.29 TRINITY_DN10993_c0_g1_i1:57-668(+)